METQPWAVALVIIGTILGALGPIYLKKASSQLKPGIRSVITNRNLAAGLGLYALATIVFVPSLKGGDLSVLYPLVAVGYIWVCLLSVKILKERMHWNKWLGIALIILGVAFIGIGAAK